jgi:hypothetical protein
MVRTFLIAMIFTTGVLANDIYVSQTTTDPSQDETKPAFQQPAKNENFEKTLTTNNDNKQIYCSVVAGCQ